MGCLGPLRPKAESASASMASTRRGARPGWPRNRTHVCGPRR